MARKEHFPYRVKVTRRDKMFKVFSKNKMPKVTA